jgi:hypothetical protein
MTNKHLATQIRNLLRLLIDSEVAVIVNPVVDEQMGSLTRVTWRSPGNFPGSLFSTVFATVGEYRGFIDAQSYSAVLYDGAILQMSYDFIGNSLVGHRLCYYPCPFDVDYELLRSEPIGDVIAYYSESRDININLRSPFRFDYDERSAKAGHPSVHMHLINAECRWPVSHPVSVGDFIRLIFRHFYPNMWVTHDFLREWPRNDRRNRTISPGEESEIHVACGRPKASPSD